MQHKHKKRSNKSCDTPHDLLDPNPTNISDFIMMVSREYSTKNTWFIEYEVTGPPEQKKKYEGEVIQISTVRGTAKSRIMRHLF